MGLCADKSKHPQVRKRSTQVRPTGPGPDAKVRTCVTSSTRVTFPVRYSTKHASSNRIRGPRFHHDQSNFFCPPHSSICANEGFGFALDCLCLLFNKIFPQGCISRPASAPRTLPCLLVAVSSGKRGGGSQTRIRVEVQGGEAALPHGEVHVGDAGVWVVDPAASCGSTRRRWSLTAAGALQVHAGHLAITHALRCSGRDCLHSHVQAGVA